MRSYRTHTTTNQETLHKWVVIRSLQIGFLKQMQWCRVLNRLSGFCIFESAIFFTAAEILQNYRSDCVLHRQQRWVCTLGDTLGRRCSLGGFQPTPACKGRIITKSKGKWWHSPVSRWVQPPRRPRDLFTTKLSLHLRGREKGQRNCKRWKYISF